MAVRGIHGVTLQLRDPSKTLAFMADFMDVAVVDETERGMRVAVNGNAPGRLVELARAPDAPAAINGLGTVHHVAFAVDDPQQQLELRKELMRRGVAVTDVMDRQYFRSIYFREPGCCSRWRRSRRDSRRTSRSPTWARASSCRHGRKRVAQRSRQGCRW
jgi:glyoxalase family protein